MRFHWMSIHLMTVLFLSAGSINPTPARTQDTGRDPVHAAATDPGNGRTVYVENANHQIDDFLGDVQTFVQNDILSPVNQFLRSTLGALQIPDLSQLWNQIMNGSANGEPGAVLSETLETKIRDRSSYGIRADLGKYAIRNTATGVATQATLGQDAQTQIVRMRQATRQNTQENVRLGEKSQELDVTQHILQNLSQQTALNSQVNERVLQEAQQARIDRAMNNTLSAQMASELAAMTTVDRRRTISAGNTASQQAGLLMMPGGVTLTADP